VKLVTGSQGKERLTRLSSREEVVGSGESKDSSRKCEIGQGEN